MIRMSINKIKLLFHNILRFRLKYLSESETKNLKESSNKNSNNVFLPAIDGRGYQIKVPYEYPFSMSDNDLLDNIKDLEKKYNDIYRTTNLTLYISKGEYQNGIVSKIEDVEHLISVGKNELSRRTNDLILKKSLIISKWTLAIAIASVIVAIISIFR
jgi:hypothetical protein